MANKSISQLNAGAAVAAGNLVPVVQTVGVGPVKITASAFGDYFLKGTYTSNTLVYDSANNNIGIGTTTPTNIAGATTLSINATGVNQSGVVVFQNSGSQLARQGILSGFFTIQDLGSANGLVIDEQSALPVIFKTTALERMRITSAGNICIGATSVIANEVMRLGYAAQNSILLGNTAQDNAGFVGAFNDFSLFGVNRNPSTGVVVNTNKYTAQIAAFGSTTESYISFSTSTVPNVNPTERMRITSAGLIGIGTTTPTTRLQVNVPSNTSAFLVTDNTASDFQIIPGITSGVCMMGPSAGALAIKTNDVERMRITSTGNVGIGTTSPNGRVQINDTNRIFDGWGNLNVVVTDAAATGIGGAIALGAQNTAGGTTPLYVAKIQGIKETSASSYNGALIFGTTASTSALLERMRIDSSGNVGIGTTSPTTRLDVNGNVRAPQIYSSPTALSASNSTITWDANVSSVASVTLTLNPAYAVTMANIVAGGTYLLIITQGSGGNKTVSSWTSPGPVNFKWVGGAAPTLSTAAGAIDIITAYSDGTTIYASAQIGFA